MAGLELVRTRNSAYSFHMSFHGATETDISNALQELKTSLTARLGTSRVKLVMFGSRARGDYDDDSDIDIAIVIKGLDSKLKNEIIDLIADIEVEYLVPLSTLVLSQFDFDNLMKRERRIALDIDCEGIAL